MDPDTKESKQYPLESDWVQDAFNLQRPPPWVKRLATGLTVLSCSLYCTLFLLVWKFRLQAAENIRELPIFTRVVLNIYQPFLVVFIIISLALLVFLHLKLKRSRWSYKPLMVLIVFNSLFAATLIFISILKLI